MKLFTLRVVALASSAITLALPLADGSIEELYTIELAPGEIRQVTEAQKWELRKEGKNFMDITEFLPITSKSTLEKRAPVYPTAVTQQAAIKPLLATLSTANMQSNLETFSEFFNRYYKSSYGAKSSAWLQSQVQSVITASGAKNVTVKAFPHSWGQNSIIATIPSKSSKLVILGSHQDSINLNNPSNGKAPGADDDGSGSVTILEAMRVLLSSPAIASGQAANTIEFHWYSAEEAGLLGSQAIFTSYKNAGKNVVAMMQQDMTGYAQGTTDAGKPEAMGVIVDYVDTSLTSFIKKVITAYCAIPGVETKCGYACSDHASASKAGYPSSFIFESEFGEDSPYIHSEKDTVATVSYDHMREHAKMSVGYAYELAFASL